MARYTLKEIQYDNTNIVTFMSRKALQAKEDAEGNIISQAYLKKGDVVEIPLSSSTGTFSPEVMQILNGNYLVELFYNNCYYKIAYKDANTKKYMTDILDVYSNMQVINVNLNNRAWSYDTIGNQALINHINNTNVHIQEGERNYWNNKITCDKQGETLILTKENT